MYNPVQAQIPNLISKLFWLISTSSNRQRELRPKSRFQSSGPLRLFVTENPELGPRSQFWNITMNQEEEIKNVDFLAVHGKWEVDLEKFDAYPLTHSNLKVKIKNWYGYMVFSILITRYSDEFSQHVTHKRELLWNYWTSGPLNLILDNKLVIMCHPTCIFESKCLVLPS